MYAFPTDRRRAILSDELPDLSAYLGGDTGPFRGWDTVNAPMIRHWCEAMGDDRDMNGGESGWWFYVDFSAVEVPLTLQLRKRAMRGISIMSTPCPRTCMGRAYFPLVLDAPEPGLGVLVSDFLAGLDSDLESFLGSLAFLSASAAFL